MTSCLKSQRSDAARLHPQSIHPYSRPKMGEARGTSKAKCLPHHSLCLRQVHGCEVEEKRLRMWSHPQPPALHGGTVVSCSSRVPLQANEVNQ